MQSVVIPVIPDVQVRRILFATDLSEPSCATLPLVATIARRYHSEILIAHVCSPPSFPVCSSDAVSMLEAREKDEIRERVGKFLHSPELAGLETQVLVKRGRPGEELEVIVEEHRIDLVVLNTHGRTGMGRLLMGSVAERLFRRLQCPVLILGPHIDQRFCRQSEIVNILYPTDLSVQSKAVLPYVTSLAHEYKASVEILHVLPKQCTANPDAGKLAEPFRSEMENIFRPEMGPGCKIQFAIDSGETSECILEHARANNTDLIAFGVRRAPEVSTHFASPVAYQVAIQAACPVLTARCASGSRLY
jgi:nucleotide-binding universal stress UspA family protein